jgi:hypothetical protein
MIARMVLDPQVRHTLQQLLRELLDGPPEAASFVLNPGDSGLFRSLAKLSAADASARSNGGSSIAAHVHHLRYGFELMNRWAKGENPFADADYAASWAQQEVTDEEWRARRDGFEREARAWLKAIEEPRELDDTALSGMIGSIAHLAYHLGAIRQIAPAARGPKARD